MAISRKVKEVMSSASWIRKMFETGRILKEKHGADKVFDFTIGNPSLEPPAKFTETAINILTMDLPGKHGYMPNAGYPHVREKLTAMISQEQQVKVTLDNILMTCGAGGALNVAFKTILNDGDTVLSPSPCFMEYRFYAENHGGNLKTVPSNKDFSLNLDAFASQIDKTTAAVIINSPNNPSGYIYSAEDIKKLGQLLDQKGKEIGRTIYLISDEPYRKIVYDNAVVPPILALYKNAIVVTSYSKDLSIPGERIGWLVVNPQADYLDDLIAGMILCNRILGYVNAPSLMQRIVAEMAGEHVDISIYKRKRDLLCQGLEKIGYQFVKPQGTFYLLSEVPGGDDLKFVDALAEELVLAVPGRGFGIKGYFRLAYCVDDSVINNSMPAFEKAYQKFK